MGKNKPLGFLMAPALPVILALAFTGCDVGTTVDNFNITHAVVPGGTINVSHNAATAGTAITLTALPAAGYAFEGWVIIPEVTILPNANTTPATFLMPESNVVVSAHFAAASHTVTAQTPSGNGAFTVSPDTPTVPVGATVTLTATPGTPEHRLGTWLITPTPAAFITGDLTTDEVAFAMPNAPLTVGAVFLGEGEELTSSSVTLDEVGSGTIAVVAPADLGAVFIGATVTLTAVPDEGYEFVIWSATPNVAFTPNANSATVSFTMPGDNILVTATFVEAGGIVTGMPDRPVTELTEFDWFPTAGAIREYAWSVLQLGYYVSGIGLGGYVFYHMDTAFPPLRGPSGGVHSDQLSGFFEQHVANGIGRVFALANAQGEIHTYTPRSVPANARGITFWALTGLGEPTPPAHDQLVREGPGLYGLWYFLVTCEAGNTASMYFEIQDSWSREQFALVFPEGFNPTAIADYGFFSRPDIADTPGVLDPDQPSGFFRVSRMSFFDWAD